MTTLADQMSADALEAMKLTRKFFVVELDFSEDSVLALELAVEDVDFASPGGRSDANVERLTKLWGAYLGEVVRRNRGGEWIATSDETGAPAELRGAESAIRPHDQVRERLVEGARHNLWDYYQRVQDGFT